MLVVQATAVDCREYLLICFQNGNPQNPMCQGIDGVTAAYYHSIQRVQLYGKLQTKH